MVQRPVVLEYFHRLELAWLLMVNFCLRGGASGGGGILASVRVQEEVRAVCGKRWLLNKAHGGAQKIHMVGARQRKYGRNGVGGGASLVQLEEEVIQAFSVC